jgi:hypothetical protein
VVTEQDKDEAAAWDNRVLTVIAEALARGPVTSDDYVDDAEFVLLALKREGIVVNPGKWTYNPIAMPDGTLYGGPRE